MGRCGNGLKDDSSINRNSEGLSTDSRFIEQLVSSRKWYLLNTHIIWSRKVMYLFWRIQSAVYSSVALGRTEETVSNAAVAFLVLPLELTA